MDDTAWQQVNISYPGPTPDACEQHAVAHLNPVLLAAETAGLMTGWWFIRKGPWRIRYLPTDNHDHLDRAHQLLTNGVTWTPDIYEPETHAFGGTNAMTAAHQLFHHDSRHLLTYLDQHPADRRERSLILCTALMRAAALDPNEQGDVWAKALDHRAHHANRPTTVDHDTWQRFTSDTRRLLIGTPRMRDDWHTAFADTGANLRRLRETGKLTRGLREVIALHVIFHWNRIGLPAQTQATLAKAAKEAVFGSAPALPSRQ